MKLGVAFSAKAARQALRDWTLLAGWAALIFIFSTEAFSAARTSPLLSRVVHWVWPSASTELTGLVHYFLRKAAHWTEYLIFAVLLSRAIAGATARHAGLRHALWTLLVVFVYAAGDELHQLFVPGRTASVFDVLIDLSGGICGTFWLFLRKKSNH